MTRRLFRSKNFIWNPVEFPQSHPSKEPDKSPSTFYIYTSNVFHVLIITAENTNTPVQYLQNQSRMALSMFGGRRSNIFDPFSLDVWDPFGDTPFTSSLAYVPPSSSSRETEAVANVHVDWRETPEAHVFKVDLPGLRKEEVKVEVEDGRILQISGEKTREQEDVNDKWHRIERRSGKFTRRFRLPESARMDQIKATMENGELRVVVPKEQEKQREVKAIDISG